MNPDAERTLQRFLEQSARPARRRAGRISTAPIVLGLGLLLGYQLLVRLVPLVWSATLPGWRSTIQSSSACSSRIRARAGA